MWTKQTSLYCSEIGNDFLHYIKDYFSLAQKSVCPRSQEYSGRGKNKNLDFLSPNLPFRQVKPSKYPGEGDMQAPCQIGNRRGREFDIVTGQIFSSSWELYLQGPFQQMLELKEKVDLCSCTSEALGAHRQAVNQSTDISHPFADIPGEFTSDTNYSTHSRWFSNMYQQIFKVCFSFLATAFLCSLKKCPLING